MASGRFSKQAAPYLGVNKLNPSNNNSGDTVVGGTVTAAPGNVGASQFEQNYPGDRFIFSPADAILYQNNNTGGNNNGTLFTGTYRYVATRNNSSASYVRAHGVFWDLAALSANNLSLNGNADATYQTTADEAANIGTSLFAGVLINNLGSGNLWFIQESGKVWAKFRATLTGVGTIGIGAYLAAGGNNNNAADVGSFDVLQGANGGTTFSAANTTTAYNAIDNMFTRFVGVCETAASNNNISLIDINFWRGGYRW